MAEAFFEGLTVVELADRRNQYLGKLLSDGGARVIQIEPLDGSPGRTSGPFVQDVPDLNRCLDYWYYNTGKLSVSLDVGRPAGRELVRRLMEKADIFLESTHPGQMQQWGLDYGSLPAAVRESIIYASVTDFGQTGPWKDYLANDVSHLAAGGQMASSGYSDPTLPPMGGQGHQAWHIAGVMGLHSIVIALMERMGSGRGQYIDCSIHDCAAVCTELAVPQWIYGSQILYRQTGQHASPQRQAESTIMCMDGAYVNTVATELTPHLWANLIAWMKELGVDGELEDPKYNDRAFRAERWRYGNEIREGIARLLQKVTAEDAMLRAQSFGLTWGVVRAPEENYDDAHWSDRGFFVPVSHPGLAEPVSYPRGPFQCDEAPIQPAGRAPDLGEHTAAVLTEWLELGQQELQGLRQTGVIR